MGKKGRAQPNSIPGLSEDSRRFIEDFQKETDRGVALAAAAFMEDVLSALLNAAFIDHESVSRNLLEYPGVLSSFAAKTEMAFAMGLIGPQAYSDLRTIRKVRNLFAHAHHAVSFEDDGVRDLCKNLDLNFLESTHRVPRARDRFTLRSVLLINEFLINGHSQQHTTLGKDITGGHKLEEQPEWHLAGGSDEGKLRLAPNRTQEESG